MANAGAREVPAEESFEAMDYAHYLRTGRRRRRALPEYEPQELKFNPWHDPTNGQFTFGPGSAGHPVGAVYADRGASRAARLKPTTGAAAQQPMRELGILSERYESRGDPGAISPGNGDKGGASYGSYQFATDVGALHEFLASADAQPWAIELQGLKPATPAFDKVWKAIAAREPARFHAAQKRYIQRAYFDVSARVVQARTGYDITRASNAAQQVLWSTSVQHGAQGGASIVVAAIKETDLRVGRGARGHQQILINSVYKRRIASFKAQSERFRSQGKYEFSLNSRNVYMFRLPKEHDEAIIMLQQDLKI